MKKIKRKITCGAILVGCTLFAFGAVAVLDSKDKNGAVPVSVGYETEKPIILLDAGHGECS